VKGAAAALRAVEPASTRTQLGIPLLNDLLLTSELPVAAQSAVDLLRDQPSGSAGSEEEVLKALLRILAANTPTRAWFHDSVEPVLTKAAGGSPKTSAERMANELKWIFEDQGTPVGPPHSLHTAESRLSPWTKYPEMRQPLALLLRNVAEEYRTDKSPDPGAGEALKKALVRYAFSWWLDPSDTNSALSMAVIIHSAPELDPGDTLAEKLSKYYVTGGWAEVPIKLATDEDPGRRYLELTAKDWGNISLMYEALQDVKGLKKQGERLHKTQAMANKASKPAAPVSEVTIDKPIVGDRYASGTVPADSERVILRVYDDPPPDFRPDAFSQATLGFLGRENSRFLGTFQQPLRPGDLITCDKVLSDASIKPCGLQVTVRPAFYVTPRDLLSHYRAYFTAGTGAWHSPSRWGADAFYHLVVEFSASTLMSGSSAGPDAESWVTKVTRRPRILLKSFYDLRRDAIPGTVMQPGRSFLAESRVYVGAGGFYAPVVSERVAWNYGTRFRYEPFAAPLFKLGLESISNTSRRFTQNWAGGFRFGLLRTPLTLRAVDPEARDFIDFLYGTGLTYRQGLGDPGLQLPRQMQIRAEMGIPHTPIMGGLSKTVGQGPRDLQLYVGIKLDLLSLVNVFSPRSRGF
jgi:hypothetical protein